MLWLVMGCGPLATKVQSRPAPVDRVAEKKETDEAGCDGLRLAETGGGEGGAKRPGLNPPSEQGVERVLPSVKLR
jgi:hypothetical protein